MTEPDLKREIAAFIRERATLREKYDSQWVVFSGDDFKGAFDQYERATRFAVENLGSATFLVRNLDEDDEYVPLIFAEVE